MSTLLLCISWPQQQGIFQIVQQCILHPSPTAITRSHPLSYPSYLPPLESCSCLLLMNGIQGLGTTHPAHSFGGGDGMSVQVTGLPAGGSAATVRCTPLSRSAQQNKAGKRAHPCPLPSLLSWDWNGGSLPSGFITGACSL